MLKWVELDRDLVLALLTAAATSGGAIWYANAQRRKIMKEAGSVEAETDRLTDERTRAAIADALKAERRASSWADAFARAYRWIVYHMIDHHDDDPPPRDTFVASSVDDTNPGV